MKLSVLKTRPLTFVLALANAGIAALLIYHAWRGTQTLALLATTPKPFAVPELKIEPPARATNLALIQDQALFYSSRRFYTPPPPSSLPVSPPRPDYRLVGTFIIPMKPTVALLSNSSGASRKVKTGDELEGWTVQEVESGRVILQYQAETFEISNAAKKSGIGMQAAPLARTAQVVPVSGVRSLGSAGPITSVSHTTYAPSNNPRLYRPPPK